jgi:hypothetical protein
MIQITNKQRGPVQLVIRSRTAARAFTTLNIPGVGSGKNVYFLEDERHTEYVDRVEQMGLISIKRI